MWIKDKFNVQISAMRLMSAETCETITQNILNNKTSSSSPSAHSSASAAVRSTFSKDDSVQSVVETEFVESKKIDSQFYASMNTRHAFPSTLEYNLPISTHDESTAKSGTDIFT
jgi:hypothetical protein